MCSTGECHNITEKSASLAANLCRIFARQLSQGQQLDSDGNHSQNGSAPHMGKGGHSEGHISHLMEFFEIIIPIISFIGIVGNILNLLVLTRRRMLSSMDRLEKSATYGLVALALSDMLFCLMVFPHKFINQEGGLMEYSKGYVLYYKLYGISVVNLCLMVSTWLIVTMSINRYIVVVYPLHARSVLSAFRTAFTIIAVYLLSILFTLPHFMHHKVVTCQDKNGNFFHEFRPMYSPPVKERIMFYMKWVWPVVADFIPIAILGVCNTRLIWELRRATSARRRSAHGQKVRETSHKVTLTLVIIVLMLLFFVSPAEVIRYIDPYKSWGQAGFVVASAMNVLQTINFAFNFVLYCVLSPSFRQTFKSMFSRCLPDKTDKAELQSMLTQGNTRTMVTDTELID